MVHFQEYEYMFIKVGLNFYKSSCIQNTVISIVLLFMRSCQGLLNLFRFYRGRRTEDDERQVGRWLRCAGTTGRWKNNLISKCYKSGCAFDNMTVSPVVRQTLQHWAYKLTKEDFDSRVKILKKKGA